MSDLKIKVCGMRDKENLMQLLKLNPDYVGFIFYPQSARYVGDDFSEEITKLATKAKKVGVFVNAAARDILDKVDTYGLNAVQLHGDESPELTGELQSTGLEVIKAFRVDEIFDFDLLEDYKNVVNYFLFDTKTKLYGGSGKKFDWSILSKYKLSVPLFLSGGIGADDADAISEIKQVNIFALDLNSKFEDAPGLKNISKLSTFIQEVKNKS